MRFIHALSVQMLQNAGNIYCVERREIPNGTQEIVYRLNWVKTIEAPLYNYERLKLTNISTGLDHERTVLGWASIFVFTEPEILKYCEKNSINTDFINYEN